MTIHVNLVLEGNIYERVRKLASKRQSGLDQAILEHLNETLEPVASDDKAISASNLQSEALAKEQAAYLKLHPALMETHMGKYVAIYRGKLIDEDSAMDSLIERVRNKHPEQIVWMTEVKDKPIQTIIRRGHRFYRDGKLAASMARLGRKS